MNNQDDETRFIRGSGNVFADMGIPDADEQLAKAQIAVQIAQLIAARDMTQKEIIAGFRESRSRSGHRHL